MDGGFKILGDKRKKEVVQKHMVMRVSQLCKRESLTSRKESPSRERAEKSNL